MKSIRLAAAVLFSAAVPALAGPAAADSAAARSKLLQWGGHPYGRSMDAKRISGRIGAVLGDAGAQEWPSDFQAPAKGSQGSPAFKKLVEKIEAQGQLGLDPQTGVFFKAVPAAVDAIPDGQKITMVVLTGVPDEKGAFQAQGALAIVASKQVTRQKLSETSALTDVVESQSLMQADLAGKVSRAASSSSRQSELLTVERAGADDAARAAFGAELAAVQKALGVKDVRALAAKIQNAGRFAEADEDGPARFVLPLDAVETAEGVLVRFAALEGAAAGKDFKAAGLVLVSRLENGKVAEDMKSEKRSIVLKTYSSSLDGKLTGVVTLKADRTASVDGSERAADEQAQKSFDGAVARMLQ